MSKQPVQPGTIEALLAKAQAVVDALDDVETNHGGLALPPALTKINALRLELNVWRQNRGGK
jgi:hypothetical protein